MNLEPIYEDTVKCLFFSLKSFCNQDAMNDLCKKINEFIHNNSKEYIWHRDAFRVFVPLEEKFNEDNPPHLASYTCFGDNIQDEWFIVYILLQLTKKYDDLIIQITDSDGEFILIEAANCLPSWANPETTQNRVYIYNNHLHIIPPDIISLDQNITYTDAISTISSLKEKTQVSPDLEKVILDYIGHYPDKIQENVHNSWVRVPIDLAVLLHIKPEFVAHLVTAYCHHDALDSKLCSKVCVTTDWIPVKVKFTKFLYAMLVHSNSMKSVRQPLRDDKKSLMGIKLACGYQIVMNKSVDMYASDEYQTFLNNLKRNSYFKGNLEGSLEYKHLLQKAREYFMTFHSPLTTDVSSSIVQLLESKMFLETKQKIINENSNECDFNEDNDDWLTIHPNQLNDLLTSRYGKSQKIKNEDVSPQTIETKLGHFLKKSSDFEGIEIKNDDKQLQNSIEFDPNEFVECLQSMLQMISTNNDESESIESDHDDYSMSESENDLDKELKDKLHMNSSGDVISPIDNIIKSMKEEKASSGPSSNLITNIGFSKQDFIDSDDE